MLKISSLNNNHIRNKKPDDNVPAYNCTLPFTRNVAGIDAGKPRRLLVPLDFLKPGVYSVKLYKGSTQGDGIVVKDIAIDTTQRSKISFPTGGGIAVNFSR